jgi:hypothetical protein
MNVGHSVHMLLYGRHPLHEQSSKSRCINKASPADSLGSAAGCGDSPEEF